VTKAQALEGFNDRPEKLTCCDGVRQPHSNSRNPN
jgi:hypothetical protein